MTIPAIVREAALNSHSQRSNAISHIYWPMFLCFSATIALAWKGMAVLAMIAMVAAMICLVFALGSHVYFMLKNPEALRSEKYTIQRMMLERGMQVDGVTKATLVEAQESMEISVKGAP